MDNSTEDFNHRKAWNFWRDEAKLAMFNPEQRAKYLVVVLMGLVSLIVLFVYAEDLGMDEVIVRTACGVAFVLLWPTLLAIEMFYKGSKAVKKMRSSLTNERISVEDNLRDVAVDFTAYRVAKEQEVKQLELERGDTIASLKSEVARLEEKIEQLTNVPFRVSFKRLATTNDDHQELVIAVYNDSATAIDDVLVQIEQIAPRNGTGSTQQINLEGVVYLKPCSKPPVTIHGHGRRAEFRFVHFKVSDAVRFSIVDTDCTIIPLMSVERREIMSSSCNPLPEGDYAFTLIVMGRKVAPLTHVVCVRLTSKKLTLIE